MEHAILSPSGASRWLNCTRSARLEQQFPDTAGEAAREGTLAHKLAELLIRQASGQIKSSDYKRQLKAIQSEKLYDNAMLDHCDQYAVYVMERFCEQQVRTKDALMFLEQKLNLTDYVPEGFGTGDVIIIADGVMDIIDLKYGKGVPVSAEQNRQMMLYSLGALREFDFMYDIQVVRMTIYQPRLDTISTWEMNVSDLRKWAKDELIPRARMAFDGEGEFTPGVHCQFCKAKAVCRANADYQMQVIRDEFPDPDLLTDEEVSNILERTKGVQNWLTAVGDHAMKEALNGKKWPGFKLVEGRSNRVYVDQDQVAKKLIESGFDKEVIFQEPKLLGITAMEKEITKPVFSSVLDGLILKPAGKPTLVPESDKRPELSGVEAAQRDFESIESE